MVFALHRPRRRRRAIVVAAALVVPRRRAGRVPQATARSAASSRGRRRSGSRRVAGRRRPRHRTPTLEVPEPTAGRLLRLRARLARSQSSLGRGLLSVLSREQAGRAGVGGDRGGAADRRRRRRRDDRDRRAAADAGPRCSGTRSQGELRALLAEELVAALRPDLDRSAALDARPATGRRSCWSSASTAPARRRPAASWRACSWPTAGPCCSARPTRSARPLPTSSRPGASRVGAETVRGPEGGDPASVAFDAVKQGTERKVDTVLIDTAGRLHTKVGLMDELGKVKRVVEKQGPVDETLLVLDATTGQNGLTQARVFTEVVDVTGIVLTKLDGTAKGGIVISVQRELGVPVKLVGLGEGADDLAPFDPEQFVDALLGGESA